VAVEDAVELQRQRQLAERARPLRAELGGAEGRGVSCEVLAGAAGAPTASATSRSPLPRIQRTGTVSASRRASVAAANGPGTASPPTSTASGRAARGSASTASSASTLPWMS
jgi:hypothetical protein